MQEGCYSDKRKCTLELYKSLLWFSVYHVTAEEFSSDSGEQTNLLLSVMGITAGVRVENSNHV